MAENQAGVAEQEQVAEQSAETVADSGAEPVAESGAEQADEYQYSVQVEDLGPAVRKVTVEIPRERIVAKLDEQYKELRSQTTLPGFRVGHAPRKLLEKRFGANVKDQVAGTLVRESYEQALAKNKLEVIGDPEFENQEAVKLPDEGSLSYSFQVEVQPNFTMPDFSSLTVKKPKITITEQNVDQAMQNLREQQGALVPVEDRGVQTGDYILADVHVKLDGVVAGHQHDAAACRSSGSYWRN